jgi:uncharacterized membrane protein
MQLKPEDIAARLLGRPLHDLDAHAQRVARHIANRKHIAHNAPFEGQGRPSFGQRAADRVAAWGGSWTFVSLFTLVIVAWVVVNTLLMMRRGSSFDPYPFILLNLVLSMVAAIQAPVILMSQNREAETDRQSAAHDYEVNLKAELEIMLLHDKLDQLRQIQWAELVEMQREQLKLLTALVDRWGPAPADTPDRGPQGPSHAG